MNTPLLPATGKTEHRLAYRPDIQGLRAVAILLVVAAHARLEGFAGGFVGVDVFFVLSGYLITALLVEEMRATGRVEFAKFYVRRLRRLLPGLFLMLVVVGYLAWQLIPAMEQTRQSASAMNAAAWISNIYFGLLQVGYFSPSAASNLFLHTWSLGVEEQFYLFWPMLVVATFTGWNRHPSNHSAKRMLGVLVGLAAISLALCLYWSYHSPKLAFYMMPSRGWQFALGGLVYMVFGVSSDSRDPRTKPRFRLPAGYAWPGLAMMLGSAMLLDGHDTYPGFWALIPSFGAAALIAAGIDRPGTSISRMLSVKPMRFVGQVSYSWYLWHWPILLLGTYALGYDSPVDRLLLVSLSLAFAIAGHRLVEHPIRHARLPLRRPRFSLIVAVGLAAAAILLGQMWRLSTIRSMREPAQIRMNIAQSDTPLIYLQGCDAWYTSASVKPCIYGNPHASHTAVVIGDSIGLQWFPAIHEIFKKPHWRLIVLTKSSCPMVDAPYFYPRIKRVYARCAAWRKAAFARLSAFKPDITMIGTTYTYPFSRTQWIEGTRKLLAEASKVSGKVYLIRSTPSLPFNGPDCLSPHSRLYRWLSKYPSCSAPADNPAFDEVFTWQRMAASAFSNVSMLDMTSSVCPGNTCKADRGGLVVFRDDQHMTASFSRTLAPQLAKAIKLASHPDGRLLHAGSAAGPR